jgi:hypothetical protein
MLKVVRIVGESYELDTGKKIPKSFVLSNGMSEVSIPATDLIIEQVLSLVLDAKGQSNIPKARAPISTFEDLIPKYDLPKDPEVPVDQIKPLVLEEREVGEEYRDPETGVASI